jgi:hypothetical protein
MTKRKDEEEIPSKPEELKDFVDETTRLHLSENDLKVLEDALLNPKEPNENIKKAAEEYKRRGVLLAEIMKNDEEMGLYNEPFDNPLVKEPSVTPQNASEMMITTDEDIIESIPSDDKVSDWDVTLMDGLEDEEPFFTEEEMEKISQEEPTEEEIQRNFSTIEPEMENIFHKEEDFDGFVSEPFEIPEELVPHNIDVEIINETLDNTNEEIDNKINISSSEEEDEKKKY